MAHKTTDVVIGGITNVKSVPNYSQFQKITDIIWGKDDPEYEEGKEVEMKEESEVKQPLIVTEKEETKEEEPKTKEEEPKIQQI